MIEKAAGGVARCSHNDGASGRLLELPIWMFDRSACAPMRIGAFPRVDIPALQALRVLLDATAIGGVAVRLASSNARVLGAAKVSHDQNRGEAHATPTAASTRPSKRDAAVRFVRYGERRQHGTEAVVNSLADGYTLLLVSPANAIHATLYERLNYNFIRDIQPIVHLASAPLVMVVHPSVPVKSVPEFIAYAKANPGKINMASAGTGSTGHVTGELFKMMAKIDMVHVPYRGAGPAMTDLLGGQVQVLFDNVPSAIQYIRAGSLRALAVTTAMRSEALPDVPVVADFVSGYEVSVWYGIGAPKNTPPQIVDRLNREINAILSDTKMKTRLADMGVTGTGGSSETFREIIAEETTKWGKVVRTANIKPE